ncbi:MAG: hypothetical protein COV75_00170 [Candidatus Omnitrophica bacterium CG11_big_fil_rev_8_21_14_0_20_63_9]|nr:MAG: hypothetical protein COV75_00170 [Candidatus Omnitrophica bacterium CG11_big_fil_rev_8_21_14_0_20_63_9]
MAYLIDRDRAIWSRELVVIVPGRQRGIRSRAILRDNSQHQTRTRPRTLARYLRAATALRGRVPRAVWPAS